MKVNSFYTIASLTGLLTFLLLFSSCKSEFEQVRTSGDGEVIYKKALEYYEEKDFQKSQTLLELAITSYRGKREAEDIHYKYAYTYYYLGRYILAAHYFRNFAQTYGASQFKEEADFMAAYSNYQLSPTFRLDQSYTAKAIDELQLFINTYPSSERVEECNRLIDEMRLKLEKKAFEEGRLYFDLRYYQSAVHSFENMLKDFPETTSAPQVRYLIVRSNFLLAENSIADKQPERYRETIDLASEYLERYDKNSFAKEVRNILEDSRKRLK